MNREDASIACKDRHNGAYLTSIMNAEENEFLRELADGTDVWIGAHRETSDGPWIWSDNTPCSYNKWGYDPTGKCVYMAHSRGHWFSTSNCNPRSTSLCKYSL